MGRVFAALAVLAGVAMSPNVIAGDGNLWASEQSSAIPT